MGLNCDYTCAVNVCGDCACTMGFQDNWTCAKMMVGATHAQWVIMHAQVSIGIIYVLQIGERYACAIDLEGDYTCTVDVGGIYACAMGF